MLISLGLAALVALIAAFVAAIGMATRQARRDEAPKSEPTDFVAPVSSGGYRWRGEGESPEDFKKRVTEENRSS